MNWKDLASAGKSISKLDSLDLKPETRDCMEAVMCAMAASGKVQQMALIAQTLEKVDVQTNIAETLAELNKTIGSLRQPKASKVPDEGTVTLTKAQFEELKTQLSK